MAHDIDVDKWVRGYMLVFAALLVGTIIMLPLILAYVAYCYYIFRGKASHESTY